MASAEYGVGLPSPFYMVRYLSAACAGIQVLSWLGLHIFWKKCVPLCIAGSNMVDAFLSVVTAARFPRRRKILRERESTHTYSCPLPPKKTTGDISPQTGIQEVWWDWCSWANYRELMRQGHQKYGGYGEWRQKTWIWQGIGLSHPKTANCLMHGLVYPWPFMAWLTFH